MMRKERNEDTENSEKADPEKKKRQVMIIPNDSPFLAGMVFIPKLRRNATAGSFLPVYVQDRFVI
jgi:hypothetical protein